MDQVKINLKNDARKFGDKSENATKVIDKEDELSKAKSFKGNNSELLDFDLNETVCDLARSESPSLISSKKQDSKQNQLGSDSPTSNQEGKKLDSPCPSLPSNDDDDEADEKVKNEADDKKTFRSLSDHESQSSPSRPPPAKPDHPVIIRAQCWYGLQCYRKNPQHKKDFSHPSDPDWDRPKTNARQPKKAVKKRQRRKSSSASDSDIAESLRPDSPLPAKRKRKTVQRQSLSEPESEEDPYKTDGSDEWQSSKGLKCSYDKSE